MDGQNSLCMCSLGHDHEHVSCSFYLLGVPLYGALTSFSQGHHRGNDMVSGLGQGGGLKGEALPILEHACKERG